MVNFGDANFGVKVEKLIEKLSAEDGFYLSHVDSGIEWSTVFGNGHIAVIIPAQIGEPKHADTGISVLKLISDSFTNDDAMKNMRWVPLPKIGDLKVGRDPENPVLAELAATDMEPGMDTSSDECATYPFYVQTRYLKMALQLTSGFHGYRDPRRISNPLYMYAIDNEGRWVRVFIMPHRGVSE